ncbi:MAG: PHP domain-containing protein [Nanobdellota archaeon]
MLETDLHIHTVLCGHAYGTLNEIINEAKRKNLSIIGINEHGPATGTEIPHFTLGHRKPEVEGLKILWGAEANIIDKEGNLDIPENIQAQLDYVSAGFHLFTGYEDQGFEKNTEALIRVIENPNVKFITHPTHQSYPFDLSKVCEKAIENNVLLELNLSYLDRDRPEDFRLVVDLVRKKGKKLIVNSDAHFLHEIGDDSKLRERWDELGLSEDLIINNHPEELKRFFAI